MKISISCDHAGLDLKNQLVNWLNENGYETLDNGTNTLESCDYPDYAFLTAKDVANKVSEYGVIICGTGIGVSITANKVAGIRAANCCSTEMARLAREHNNANVLTIGARLIDTYTAKKILEIFLNTDFAGGRHQNRIEKLHTITGR